VIADRHMSDRKVMFCRGKILEGSPR
jgi:hypothetical protein